MIVHRLRIDYVKRLRILRYKSQSDEMFCRPMSCQTLFDLLYPIANIEVYCVSSDWSMSTSTRRRYLTAKLKLQMSVITNVCKISA